MNYSHKQIPILVTILMYLISNISHSKISPCGQHIEMSSSALYSITLNIGALEMPKLSTSQQCKYLILSMKYEESLAFHISNSSKKGVEYGVNHYIEIMETIGSDYKDILKFIEENSVGSQMAKLLATNGDPDQMLKSGYSLRHTMNQMVNAMIIKELTPAIGGKITPSTATPVDRIVAGFKSLKFIMSKLMNPDDFTELHPNLEKATKLQIERLNRHKDTINALFK